MNGIGEIDLFNHDGHLLAAVNKKIARRRGGGDTDHPDAIHQLPIGLVLFFGHRSVTVAQDRAHISVLWMHAGECLHPGPVFHEHDQRNTLNAERCGDVGIFIDVYLIHAHAGRLLPGDGFEQRREQLAREAPVGVQIEHEQPFSRGVDERGKRLQAVDCPDGARP